MCTYLTSTEKVAGTGLGAQGWFSIEQAVVYFDHPQEAPVEHALCIDFRAGGQPIRASGSRSSSTPGRPGRWPSRSWRPWPTTRSGRSGSIEQHRVERPTARSRVITPEGGVA